jgi:hypothetical protein
MITSLWFTAINFFDEVAIALEFYDRRITPPKGDKVSSPVDSFQRITGSVAIAG